MKVKQVLKMYGDWCSPCKVYAPTFDKVSNEMSDSGIEFVDVDIDKEENQDLLVKFKIKGVPTTVKIYDSGEFETKGGMLNEFQLKEFINS
jgi:thioredoxin 1